MSKNVGLSRFAKFVHYIGIAIAALILLIPIYTVFVNNKGFDGFEIGLIIFAVIVYFIGKGIAWIIEGFSKGD